MAKLYELCFFFFDKASFFDTLSTCRFNSFLSFMVISEAVKSDCKISNSRNSRYTEMVSMLSRSCRDKFRRQRRLNPIVLNKEYITGSTSRESTAGSRGIQGVERGLPIIENSGEDIRVLCPL